VNALWYYAIGFVIIWVLAILFKDQLKIDINGPVLMRRTLRMRDLIDSIAQKSPKFWRIFMNIGIPVSVFFMGLMIYFIILSLNTFLEAPAATPILPGVDYPGNPLLIPLGYGLIGLATVIIVHEFAHGILARVEKIKIKSIGVLLLAILPGAFVEPDEEGVKKASRLAKLRIYAAGSIFNLSFAGIALLIVFLVSSFGIAPAFHSDGTEITSVVPNSPANGLLKEGMIIYSINGKTTNNITEYAKALNNTKIGDELIFQTDQGVVKVKTGVNPNNSTRSYIGVRSTDHQVINQDVSAKYGNSLPWVLFYLKDLFYWIFLLNFAVGTFNLLPMKPLDGGHIFEEILSYKLSKKTVKPIVNGFSLVLISFLVVSLVYGIGRGILLSF
jgi:membrane-associated protease RseP (regulator of RpoE activity)